MFTAHCTPRLIRAAVLPVLTLLCLSIAQGVPASSASTLATLYEFTDDANNDGDGAYPYATLVVGPDGNFYGTTESGGTKGNGTVFTITSSGTLATLYAFGTQSSDGADPEASLVRGSDDNLYGTTQSGGTSGNGTVFKITPSGTLTTLYSFTNDANSDGDGASPFAALVVGPDGNFYGTTKSGGTGGDGTVFKITPSGTLTTLYAFSAVSGSNTNNDGAVPYAALVVGPDGNFYGTTESGGTKGNGTVFKITSSGTLATLYAFGTQNGDGAYPYAALVVGPDSNFYGTTYGSGTGGTVFKITSSGTLVTLYAFGTQNGDGAAPNALAGGPDGNFYGTTEFGGTNGSGTVFKITPSGTLTTLYTFSALSTNLFINSDGGYPNALVVGLDGNFYGTALIGGISGTGTVFELDLSSTAWTAVAAGAGAGGTGRILWDRSDGAAGLWSVNASDAQTAVGPTYGPYAGWTAKAVATATDGTSRVLWTNTNGMAGIWTLNAAGVETLEGPAYGPYSGWTAQAVGVANDGTSRVLWTNTNGQAGVWSFGTNDAETLIGPTYGPYSGWSAKSLATATDGTSRVLWDNANGMAGVWSFGTNDARTVIGTTYGPYSGWTAKAVGVAGDGTSRVLWTNANGDAGIWSFNASDMETVIGAVQGPYSGWTAGGLATASDGTSRVLWDNATRAAGVWSFGANDAESVVGSVYGPF